MENSSFDSSFKKAVNKGEVFESSLDWIVAEFETSFAEGDFQNCLKVLEAHMIEIWFGVRPDRLRYILARVLREDVEITYLTRGYLQFLDTAGQMLLDEENSEVSAFRVGISENHKTLDYVGRAYALRSTGKVEEAREIMLELYDSLHHGPDLLNRTRGWNQFALTQIVVTCILAGDFETAIDASTEAQFQTSSDALPFLTRDSYLKPALMHSAFGDPKQARNFLELSRKKGRSISWIEEIFDSLEVLTEIFLEYDDPAGSLEKLLGLELASVGEMWPFYILATQRVYERLGKRKEGISRLKSFKKIPFPAIPGKSFVGSVIPVSLALSHIQSTNLVEAKVALDEADKDNNGTKLTAMIYDVAMGNSRRALTTSAQIRGYTYRWRQLELTRRAVTVSAHLRLKEYEEAKAILRSTLAEGDGVSQEELPVFTKDIHAFALENLPEWPKYDGEPAIYNANIPFADLVLSAREIEILEMWGAGMSRDQIGEVLFVSVNTVKKHLQSIYRKLKVDNRTAAIMEAHQRGLL